MGDYQRRWILPFVGDSMIVKCFRDCCQVLTLVHGMLGVVREDLYGSRLFW